MKIIESVWWSSSCKKQGVMLPFHHFCDETKFPENYSPLPHHPPDNSAAKYAHISSPYWHLEQPNFIKPVLKCSKVMKNPIFTLFYDWSVKVNKVSRKRCFLTLNLITALLCHMYVFLSCCSTDTTVQSRNFLLLDSFDGNSSADEVTLHPIYQSVHLRAEPQHDDRVITLTEIHIDDDDEQFVLHILVCESVSSPLQ